MNELHLVIGDSEIKVNKTHFVLGSSDDCDYVNKKLSLKHMSFSFIEGNWILNAISEITINGNKLMGKTEIKDGDVIEYEDLKIVVKFVPLNKPYFRILVGNHAGSMIKVEKSGIIGRDPSADYIVEDEYVSRRHAKIAIENNKVLWMDFEAKNPTLINGKVYKTPKELSSGDEIVVGKTRLMFIDPIQKPEHEIYKKPSKRPIFIALLSVFVLISVLATYFWTSYRINNFYIHYNSGKESLSRAFETSKIEEKIQLLKYAIYEFEKAKGFAKLQDLDELINLANKRLKSWEEVLMLKNELNKGNLDEVKRKLESLSEFLSNDGLFNEIYSQILRARFISENLSVARALKEQGKEEEVKKILEIVETKPEVEITQTKSIELKSTIEEEKIQVKTTKIEEPKLISDIKIDVPQLGGFEIKPEKQKAGFSGSLDMVMRLKELYQDKGNLEETIKLANEILKNEPNNASAEFYLELAQRESRAIQLENEGRYKEAMEVWSSILKLDPNNIRAKKAVVRIGSKL
ncbi:MAG: FHA domain-containing protein [candidate division WOR-3 bacterium]|nr:FHA domain-containing protein [candidate division WOR-3 bacterium]MCX7948369.1 FHA domain-containing protein [candidate division WOR-3 bacterium]MDW8151269.1 FHA domain-containing protein [candidate division WOR-3 bacterium]